MDELAPPESRTRPSPRQATSQYLYYIHVSPRREVSRNPTWRVILTTSYRRGTGGAGRTDSGDCFLPNLNSFSPSGLLQQQVA